MTARRRHHRPDPAEQASQAAIVAATSLDPATVARVRARLAACWSPSSVDDYMDDQLCRFEAADYADRGGRP